MSQRLLVLPGDGIGPEVIGAATRIAEIVAPDLILLEAPIGGAALDTDGVPLPEATISLAANSDAVLLGAVGGPKWLSVPDRRLRPEAGLLNLRKQMGVYANLRPAFCFPALVQASSLKPELVHGLDILFVRELTGGIYFSTPRGIEDLGDGQRRGFETQSYTTSEIQRIANVAFNMARQRGQQQGAYAGVVSVDKANVLESSLLWREEVTRLHQKYHNDIALTHMYGDACAMQLVRKPKDFNVILADNLFGDVLSDEAAMLTGSIGILPSASIGEQGQAGLYEPVHGSAPDIAGANLANPCAAILSLEMALRLSLNRPDAADRVRKAVEAALNAGAKTVDLGGTLSTQGMTEAVLERL